MTDTIDVQALGRFGGMPLNQPLLRQDVRAVIEKFTIGENAGFLPQLADWSRIYVEEKRFFDTAHSIPARRDAFGDIYNRLEATLSAFETLDAKLLDEMNLIDPEALDTLAEEDLDLLLTKKLAGERENFPGYWSLNLAPLLASLRLLSEQAKTLHQLNVELRASGQTASSSKHRCREHLIRYIKRFWTDVLGRTMSCEFDSYIEGYRGYAPKSTSSKFVFDVAQLVDRNFTASSVERVLKKISD